MSSPNKLTLIAAALYGSSMSNTAFSLAGESDKKPFITLAEALLGYTHGADISRYSIDVIEKFVVSFSKSQGFVLKDNEDKLFSSVFVSVASYL